MYEKKAKLAKKVKSQKNDILLKIARLFNQVETETKFFQKKLFCFGIF